jgi:hypothetical protein
MIVINRREKGISNSDRNGMQKRRVAGGKFGLACSTSRKHLKNAILNYERLQKDAVYGDFWRVACYSIPKYCTFLTLSFQPNMTLY